MGDWAGQLWGLVLVLNPLEFAVELLKFRQGQNPACALRLTVPCPKWMSSSGRSMAFSSRIVSIRASLADAVCADSATQWRVVAIGLNSDPAMAQTEHSSTLGIWP